MQYLSTADISSKKICDEKNGWFKKGLEDRLRDILEDTIKTTCLDDDVTSITTNNTAMEQDLGIENDFSDSSGTE